LENQTIFSFAKKQNIYIFFLVKTCHRFIKKFSIAKIGFLKTNFRFFLPKKDIIKVQKKFKTENRSFGLKKQKRLSNFKIVDETFVKFREIRYSKNYMLRNSSACSITLDFTLNSKLELTCTSSRYLLNFFRISSQNYLLETRVRDYRESKGRYRNDVITSVRFG